MLSIIAKHASAYLNHYALCMSRIYVTAEPVTYLNSYSVVGDTTNSKNKIGQYETISSISNKYGIPKWFLDNYYKEETVYNRHNYKEVYHHVMFPGRYKDCKFINHDKAMRAIQKMIYTDLQDPQMYNRWSSFVQEHSIGWTRYDV